MAKQTNSKPKTVAKVRVSRIIPVKNVIFRPGRDYLDVKADIVEELRSQKALVDEAI